MFYYTQKLKDIYSAATKSTAVFYNLLYGFFQINSSLLMDD